MDHGGRAEVWMSLVDVLLTMPLPILPPSIIASGVIEAGGLKLMSIGRYAKRVRPRSYYSEVERFNAGSRRNWVILCLLGRVFDALSLIPLCSIHCVVMMDAQTFTETCNRRSVRCTHSKLGSTDRNIWSGQERESCYGMK